MNRTSIFLRLAALLPTVVLPASAVRAETPLGGSFVASRACPALQSIRKNSNPGAVQTEPGRTYPVFAENKPNGTYYWIGVAGAKPERRWVETNCGTRSGAGPSAAVDAAPAKTTAPASTKRSGSGSTDYVFAISWQPAFCETHPNKPECASQTAGRFDASNFTLHGLWPQPRSNGYCGVAADVVSRDKGRDWQQLPAPAISAATRTTLERVMPGTQSGLERHEWLRHGTCYGSDADTYFSDATRLLGAVNASPVRALFVSNVGKSLDAAAIRQAFDAGFGSGAGERVRIACQKSGDREMIAELTIGLGGKIGPDTKLSDLILASRPTKPGCPAGIVDVVGRQ